MASQASSSGPRRIAVAQMRSTNDKQHNLDQVKTIVEKAKSQNASVCIKSSIYFPKSKEIEPGQCHLEKKPPVSIEEMGT